MFGGPFSKRTRFSPHSSNIASMFASPNSSVVFEKVVLHQRRVRNYFLNKIRKSKDDGDFVTGRDTLRVPRG